MDPAALVQLAMPSLVILLVATFLSIIFGVGVGALLLSRKPVPAGISGGVMGLMALALIGVCGWASVIGSGADGPQIAVSSAVIALVVVPFFALVPASLHAIFALVGAVRDGPRRWGLVGAAVVPVAAVLALPIIGGVTVGSGFYELSWLRVIPYAGLALLTLPALAAGGEGVGRDAAATAGLAFAGFVGLTEASLRGVFWFLSFGRFLSLEDETARMALVDNASATLLSPSQPWSWATVGAALVVGVIALIPALRGPQKVGAWLGVVWLIVALLPMILATVPRSSWLAFAQALGGP